MKKKSIIAVTAMLAALFLAPCVAAQSFTQVLGDVVVEATDNGPTIARSALAGTGQCDVSILSQTSAMGLPIFGKATWKDLQAPPRLWVNGKVSTLSGSSGTVQWSFLPFRIGPQDWVYLDTDGCGFLNVIGVNPDISELVIEFTVNGVRDLVVPPGTQVELKWSVVRFSGNLHRSLTPIAVYSSFGVEALSGTMTYVVNGDSRPTIAAEWRGARSFATVDIRVSPAPSKPWRR